MKRLRFLYTSRVNWQLLNKFSSRYIRKYYFFSISFLETSRSRSVDWKGKYLLRSKVSPSLFFKKCRRRFLNQNWSDRKRANGRRFTRQVEVKNWGHHCERVARVLSRFTLQPKSADNEQSLTAVICWLISHPLLFVIASARRRYRPINCGEMIINKLSPRGSPRRLRFFLRQSTRRWFLLLMWKRFSFLAALSSSRPKMKRKRLINF